MRVLVADDDPALRERLRERFADADRRVGLCAAGWAALRGAGDDFELLILEPGLPKMSGLDVLRRFRESGVEVPAVILTSGVDTDPDAGAGALGRAIAYLVRRVRF